MSKNNNLASWLGRGLGKIERKLAALDEVVQKVEKEFDGIVQEFEEKVDAARVSELNRESNKGTTASEDYSDFSEKGSEDYSDFSERGSGTENRSKSAGETGAEVNFSDRLRSIRAAARAKAAGVKND
jgi:hypothetical protein